MLVQAEDHERRLNDLMAALKPAGARSNEIREVLEKLEEEDSLDSFRESSSLPGIVPGLGWAWFMASGPIRWAGLGHNKG